MQVAFGRVRRTSRITQIDTDFKETGCQINAEWLADWCFGAVDFLFSRNSVQFQTR